MRCNAGSETITHLLRHCPFAMQTWRAVPSFGPSDPSWQLPHVAWMQHFLNSDLGLLFEIVCWYLWKSRNERIFENKAVDPSSVAFKSQQWCSTVLKAMEQESVVLDNVRVRKQVEVAWKAGPRNWVTVNSDGSVLGNRNKAATGCLIRDNNGNYLQAYSMKLDLARSLGRRYVELLKAFAELGMLSIGGWRSKWTQRRLSSS
ncbi:Putative ribonuclease H protein At1g65750 [Linum perenne]